MPRLKTRASKPTVAEFLAVINCHRADAFRAKLILMLEGASFNTIKRRLQISAPTIIHSKQRFLESGLDGLDTYHPGQKATA